ncbi:hypothetical protein LTR08_001016 [Meristemomyces frigidus]|nr:hypothetical protein LTR08_001016 [Meristemomyces frigidus]
MLKSHIAVANMTATSQSLALQASHPTSAKLGALSTVLTANSKDIFDFEGLPAEIRNEIYDLCLTTDSPITIFRKQKYTPKIKGKRSVTGYWLKSKIGTTVKNKQRKRPYGNLHAPVILRLNHRISAEAISFLYARNCFKFDNLKGFALFAKQIGAGVRLLTDVEMVFRSLDANDRREWGFIHPLAAASKLVRLQIQVDGGRPRMWSDAWWAISPIVRGSTGICEIRFGGNTTCSCVTPEEQQRRFDCIQFVKSPGLGPSFSTAEHLALLVADIQAARDHEVETQRCSWSSSAEDKGPDEWAKSLVAAVEACRARKRLLLWCSV